MPERRVIFNPAASLALRKGFNLMADLMQVTLGPRGRIVAVAPDKPTKPPELLKDGGKIARRFRGLPDRFETIGAFLARHIAGQVEENVGDGATTAVVLGQHILNAAHRHIAAGYNIMALRRGLEKGLAVAVKALQAQAQPLESAEQIIALVTSLSGDETLGRYIEEIFDTVGAQGAIDVRRSYRRIHEREYIQGIFWNQGWISSQFVTAAGKAVLKKPYILLTNHILEDGAELAPLMAQVKRAGQAGRKADSPERGLLVLAVDVRQTALNILVTNKTRQILPTLAIKVPGLGAEKDEILQDLAALCGGKVFLKQSGQSLLKATLSDLGQADEVQAIRSGFTLIGGKGRPAAIRERIQEIRQQATKGHRGEVRREQDRLQERIGKMLGGVALLKIGGATDVERDYLRARAKKAVRVVRLGLKHGVVGGGGVALLACQPALDAHQLSLQLPEEEAVGLSILRQALAAPAEAIIRNAGHEPAPLLNRLRQEGGACGFDVQQEAIRDMIAAHILDPLDVLTTALRVGVSGAIMGLTTEVLVQAGDISLH